MLFVKLLKIQYISQERTNMGSITINKKQVKKHNHKNASKVALRRTLNLLKEAQFDLGRKTDAVKIIRKDRI